MENAVVHQIRKRITRSRFCEMVKEFAKRDKAKGIPTSATALFRTIEVPKV